MRSGKVGLLVLVLAAYGLWSAASAWAEVKVFGGAGDGTTWHDAANWSPTGVPAAADAVTVDKAGVTAAAQANFVAQSVTVGGKAASTWTVADFVYGTITPATTSDPAILLRKDGTVILKGAGGTVTAKGPFKNSEEALPTEPSVMILLQ